MNYISIIGLSCMFSFQTLIAQMTIKITHLPNNTPYGTPLHLAGNFNNWNPNDANHQFRQLEDGTWSVTFSPPQGDLWFKITRGNWETVEGNQHGQFLPNRHYYFHGGHPVFEIQVQAWEDLGIAQDQVINSAGTPSTATDNVYLLQEDFYIPQLKRHRRILIYLPKDYYSNFDKKYPVIYAHDGQNIFDAHTSFSGEWEIDESLNRLFQQGDSGVIVVGIDNGGAERLNEYTPWSHPEYGGGQGVAYTDFIVQNLKPFVDKKYRTLPEREKTCIMGSSLGGLISLYAAIKYQNVFGKAAIFSPSLWFSEKAFEQVTTIGKQAEMRIYLLAGQQEGNGSVAEDVRRMYHGLLEVGFSKSEIFLDIDDDGTHSEWYWKREFPDAYRWLLQSAF